jgi:hypothetical protein
MPGTPITNLGYQVTHPNVDDVLAQVWDAGKGRWQTVHYDSGWRDIAGLAASGWVIGAMLRRLDDTVEVVAEYPAYFDGTARTGPLMFSVPAGFRLGAGRPLYPVLGHLAVAGATGANPADVWQVDWEATLNGPQCGAPAKVAGILRWSIGASEGIPTSLPGTLVRPAAAFAFPGSIT